MQAFNWMPDVLGLIWGLAGGFFNCWLTRKILVKDMSNKRAIAVIILKPLTHLVILGCAAFVSMWFLLLAAAGDLITLAILFIKNYLDGRR